MIRFASRMELLKGSAIRELLALTAKPEIISFAGGMPAPELFPVEQMEKAANAVMEEMGQAAMQYSSTEGYVPLRQQIVDRMAAKNNIHTTVDNILVTSGSQQGLDYSGRVFLDKDDIVLIESPSYLGALNAFKTCEPRFIEVPTDDGGMIMEELEKMRPGLFIQPYRGYIVNMESIKTIEPRRMLLKSGDTILIKRGDFRKIRDTYFSWSFSEKQ